jgi:hypothetical protein
VSRPAVFLDRALHNSETKSLLEFSLSFIRVCLHWNRDRPRRPATRVV